MDFQSTLFAGGSASELRFDELERHELDAGAWVDVVRAWLVEPDDVFATMVRDVPWRAERRRMYDRIVDVPRLVYTYMIGEELPHPVLADAREALTEHYLPELGEPFRTAGCCYYRDGRDSVAWHGDTIGRGSTHDTMVAIVSVGDPRRLALRPRDRSAGAESLSFEMGHGDLLVMGGTCQRTWEHSVPKVASAGPRISIQFRPLNVF
ncbi:alpha-ketoglutarate-dependent dioxygenase AlkB [Nocardioides sp. HM23]|uniref:alpha-ketoglutarate-dependent dioxygenase AlkB n=1 Tax=Nocardioides bizhenqiangii TaxID=3095076 RepID=UPI002ACA7434|nr:alpha-ketoglutarate-dependent dioxygenase AlkB [Nocardioides sp. HM23]MDZ5621310.1 alpha-ketoglutarate-dependent dioxygenase AlkB [Nocardioides sp. HM23]